MAYDLLKDPESGAVALIDSELGRALGPVVSGPDATAVLEAFVGALGIDPAKLEHWEIQFRFNQFLEALQGDVEPDHPAPDLSEPDPEATVPTEAIPPEPSADTPGPLDPSTDGGGVAAVPTAAEGAPTDEPPAPAPADEDPTSPATGEATASATEPGTTSDTGSGQKSGPELTRPSVPAGLVTCPECEGWGTVARNGTVVTCPLCQGTGSVHPDVAAGFAEGRAE